MMRRMGKRGFVWRKMKGEMDKVRGIWVAHKQIRIAKDFSKSLNTSQGKMVIYCSTYNLSFFKLA